LYLITFVEKNIKKENHKIEMNVLSLFDGISCAKVALERAHIPIANYYACEIDKYAMAVSKKNHPVIKSLGNVKDVKDPLAIDILIGGSPCQDLSIAKKERKGLAGDRSSLFWEYVRIWKLCKPKYFILENVASMSKDDRDIITQTMGVEPIMINAGLVSAQCRKRLFWTNIPDVVLPEDRGIVLNDILQDDVDEKFICNKEIVWRENSKIIGLIKNDKSLSQANRVYGIDGKTATLSSGGGGLYKVRETVRRLTPIECERLQGLPDKYTEGISDTQRYKCLGNAFNVDVVTHILSFMK
jgi:DNA (cytosine-5)-methyltransferase 3A